MAHSKSTFGKEDNGKSSHQYLLHKTKLAGLPLASSMLETDGLELGEQFPNRCMFKQK